ncbi:MAG TPA: Pycsar system effector family protein [Chitinophagales bacterium]|nr:Pycsar system effector family protein [Chitinophagales bacterium]
MEQKLKEIYQHCFDMLKLGESKNVTLMAFNGAIIIGMLKLAHDYSENSIIYYLWCAIIGCSISTLCCLISLVAQLIHRQVDVKLAKSDNLLFFGSIAQLSPEDLLKKLSSRYGLKSENENYEKDLAKQIVITAQIAAKKYSIFNTAITWTFIGIATPFSFLLFKIFYNPNIWD